MADQKISDLTASTSLDDTDYLETSKAGTPRLSRRISASLIPNLVKDIACGDETSVLTTGTKVTFRWKGRPLNNGLKISASLTTAQASGATLVTVDVKKNGTSFFTTKVTIDNTEKTSETAATPAVISGSNNTIAYDDEITVICDAIQAGTAAAGLKVYIEGRA